jgi:hypothetical protein
VTSGSRCVTMSRFRRLGLPFPVVAVCGEDVQLGKPDPEGHRQACKRLDVAPADWIVVGACAEAHEIVEGLDQLALRIAPFSPSTTRRCSQSADPGRRCLAAAYSILRISARFYSSRETVLPRPGRSLSVPFRTEHLLGVVVNWPSVGLTDDLCAPCWSVRRIPTHGRLTPCGN